MKRLIFKVLRFSGLPFIFRENETVGNYITIDGAKIYYEEYGKGEPLLLIHGNSGSIKSMGNQIDYFKKIK